MSREWMKRMQMSGKVLTAMVLAATMASGAKAWCADTFRTPTPEELAMKSLPGYPGVSAVVLNREEITTDDLHAVQHYERIKILTDEGKKYANVELRYVRTSGTDNSGEFAGNEMSEGDIQGRTIHPDGTIIPFTGKPYVKTIEKSKDSKYQAVVFTLPDVEPGSIIEYRYSTRFSDDMVSAPQWYIQGDLYVKEAHYVWYPTSRDLVDEEQRPINAIAWLPILPPGVAVKNSLTPGGGLNASRRTYELTVKDIPPTVEEDYMPPLKSYSYRVLFSFTPFNDMDEYWKAEGKDWSKKQNNFMKSSGDLEAATQAATAGATTDDQKLRKIYAKVMTLENTDYTRERGKREEGKTSTVSDVLSHQRGSSTELTELFVAMARVAGMKAYLMLVPDRSQELFIKYWRSFQQFDSEIAIVNVDGKEVFFDPGERFCEYGHLAWQHSFVEGLRQVEGGTAFGQTLGDGYAANRTTRVANLTMDEHGQITGKINYGFTGSDALRLRHVALRADTQDLSDRLRELVEAEVPRSLQVKVTEISNVDDYEKPLQVTYEVHGTMGTATGKRLVLPMDLFESGAAATFSQEKRETAVDMRYARSVEDALRINFPKGFEVEALPKNDMYTLEKRALYKMTVESTPTSFTSRRAFVVGDVLFLQKEYPQLRTFYSQLQTKDKESVVLKVMPVVAEAKGGN